MLEDGTKRFVTGPQTLNGLENAQPPHIVQEKTKRSQSKIVHGFGGHFSITTKLTDRPLATTWKMELQKENAT